jgi:hypothetical protein
MPTMQSTKEPRAAAPSSKNTENPGKNVKALRVPPGKIVKAQAMALEGNSQRTIARELKMSAHTVSKVMKAEDYQFFFQQQREKLLAIAPSAVDSFRARVATDGILAYSFLKDLQIVPPPSALAELLNPTTANSGLDRQAQLVACVLLESV